jgi:hypothetical protein
VDTDQRTRDYLGKGLVGMGDHQMSHDDLNPNFHWERDVLNSNLANNSTYLPADVVPSNQTNPSVTFPSSAAKAIASNPPSKLGPGSGSRRPRTSRAVVPTKPKKVTKRSYQKQPDPSIGRPNPLQRAISRCRCDGAVTGHLCVRCPQKLLNNACKGLLAGTTLCNGTLYHEDYTGPVEEEQGMTLRWGYFNRSQTTVEVYSEGANPRPVGYLDGPAARAIQAMSSWAGKGRMSVSATLTEVGRPGRTGIPTPEDIEFMPARFTVKVAIYACDSTVRRQRNCASALQQIDQRAGVDGLGMKPEPLPEQALSRAAARRLRRQQRSEASAAAEAAKTDGKSQEELEVMFDGLQARDRASELRGPTEPPFHLNNILQKQQLLDLLIVHFLPLWRHYIDIL